MLKNFDLLLYVDILYMLCVMGYGDEIVICDVNFLVEFVVEYMVVGCVLWIDGVDLVCVVCVVLFVLLFDMFVDMFVWWMEVVGDVVVVLFVQCEVQVEIDCVEGCVVLFVGIDCFVFYECVQQVYVVIVIGEMCGYGCFIFKKGVLLSDVG